MLFARKPRPTTTPSTNNVRDALTVLVWLETRAAVLHLAGQSHHAIHLEREASLWCADSIFNQLPGLDLAALRFSCKATAKELLQHAHTPQPGPGKPRSPNPQQA